MPNCSKKIFISFLAVFILTAVFFSNSAQASLWNTIRAWVTINPLEVGVFAPAETEVDKVFKVEARVINKGEEKIENARGEILLSSGLVLVRKDPVQEIGIIPGKKEKKVSWSVKGEKIGSYVITVSGSGELRGDRISAEGSTKVEVKESVRKTRHQGWFQNLFDFFQERFRF